MWRFEASPRRAAPKGLPSSFAQHRIPKGTYLHPAPLFLRSWHTDITEIPTDEGKLYLATALDLFSRRLLGYATSAHPDAVLAGQAIKMAVAARGGNVAGVIFHTDRGSTYTADDFTGLCAKLKITQSMGRVGSCFDNAAAESFFSTLEWEVLSRHHFSTRDEAREVITRWVCDTTKPGYIVPVA